METPKERHQRLEQEMLKRKWDVVFDPTPMPLNKVGRLKFLYLDQVKGYENMTGMELAQILHDQHFIKIVKYIRKENGRFQAPELRYVMLNYLKREDLPRIIALQK
jgi:hypothetical protein